LTGEEFIGFVTKICVLSAIASIILLGVSRGLALMPDDSYALRGIFPHKNTLGSVMAVGALVVSHRLRASAKNLFWNLTWAILFVGVTFLSKSSTALLTIVFLYCANIVLVLYRRGGGARILGVVVLAIFAPVAGVAMLAPDTVLELIGKDPTLTGRTDLWDIVIDEISQRPVLGWGFFAFWSSANPLSAEISGTLGWTVPHAHNGILEMLLEVGVVGTAIILAIFIRNVVLSWRYYRLSSNELAVTSLFCYATIVFTGITETVIVDPSESSVCIFFILGLMCERALRALPQDEHPAVQSGPAPRGGGRVGLRPLNARRGIQLRNSPGDQSSSTARPLPGWMRGERSPKR
jgi:O-antigen ligase